MYQCCHPVRPRHSSLFIVFGTHTTTEENVFRENMHAMYFNDACAMMHVPPCVQLACGGISEKRSENRSPRDCQARDPAGTFGGCRVSTRELDAGWSLPATAAQRKQVSKHVLLCVWFVSDAPLPQTGV